MWHRLRVLEICPHSCSLRPGEAFFADYDRFYCNRHQDELQFGFHADRQTEPMKLAYMFVQNLI
jgi:hypothetical protein